MLGCLFDCFLDGHEYSLQSIVSEVSVYDESLIDLFVELTLHVLFLLGLVDARHIMQGLRLDLVGMHLASLFVVG